MSAALGGSSGGHLSLSTATFAETVKGISSRPDLLLLFYPCVDLTAQYELDYSAQAISTHGAALSPLFHLRADLPPTVVFHGSEDPLYPISRYATGDAEHGTQEYLISIPNIDINDVNY